MNKIILFAIALCFMGFIVWWLIRSAKKTAEKLKLNKKKKRY